MPDWDWEWYEADSGTEDVSLLLSVRSQQLALSALNKMDSRSTWVEVDDATWDDIEAALAETYEELMEPQNMPALDPAYVTLHRTTDFAIQANTPTAIDWSSVVVQSALVLWTGLPAKQITIPVGGAGLYQISFRAYFPSTAAVQNKSARLNINGTTVYQVDITILTLVSVGGSIALELAEGDALNIIVFCPAAVSIQGDAFGITTWSCVRVSG